MKKIKWLMNLKNATINSISNSISKVSAKENELSEKWEVENQRKCRLLKRNYIMLPFPLEDQMNGI